MDAHKIFVQYMEDRLPTAKDIHFIFVRGDVHALELIALMYGSKNTVIPMDKVFSYDRKKCQQLADKMLTALVIQHSSFDGNVQKIGSVQETIASYQGLTETATEMAGPRSEMNTPPVSPHGGESKKSHSKHFERNYVDECTNHFLFKSKKRVQSLCDLLRVNTSMRWVKAVASKVVSEDAIGNDFELISDSDRHIHISGASPCQFVEALSMSTCKTFSWSLKDDQCIHLDKLRHKVKTLISKIDDDVVPFVIIACSIGLPTFGLYTPKTFMEHWHSYRFKRLTNANVVKTACRDILDDGTPVHPKTEVGSLLERYSKDMFVLQDTPKTVESYMFKQWYSYPTRQVLAQLVDQANAVKERCT